MLQIIGAILVTASTTAVGLAAVQRLGARVTLLSGVVHALEYMQTEIYFNLTPLPVILEHLSRTAAEPLRPFFARCFSYMDRLGDSSFSSLWQCAIQESRSELTGPEAQLLADMGSMLGRYDAEAQSRAISYARTRVEGLLESAEKEKTRQSRIYGVLGVMCGLAIVIILI